MSKDYKIISLIAKILSPIKIRRRKYFKDVTVLEYNLIETYETALFVIEYDLLTIGEKNSIKQVSYSKR